MKKIISILLATIMCFGMCTVAFAAEETTPPAATEDTTDVTVNSDSIMNALLEAAKLASSLNDSAREKLSEEIQQAIVNKIAGDNPLLQGAADWIIDTILGLSGSDNLLDIDKNQAENIADLLILLYEGNLANATDNVFLKFVLSLLPEEATKAAVVWILSDGFGDSLDEFIEKYEKDESDAPAEDNPAEDTESGFNLESIIKIFTDIINKMVEIFNSLLGSLQTQPEATA